MYSTHNEGKSVVAERFIRTLKNKIDKHLTSVSKYVNDKNYVRKSKYKNIFAREYTPHMSEDVFVIKDVKNIVPWTYVINDLNGKEIIGIFYDKELQKTN